MKPTTLAIDFGTKRIGLAITRGSLAEPLEIVTNDQQAISKIKNICQREQVKQLLVGISENTMAELTKDFAQKLQEQIGLPMFFADETLSSHSVIQKLKTNTHKKRSGDIDHFAAAVILEEWMES
jgi:putative transcription antitermination factor YqgF